MIGTIKSSADMHNLYQTKLLTIMVFVLLRHKERMGEGEGHTFLFLFS